MTRKTFKVVRMVRLTPEGRALGDRVRREEISRRLLELLPDFSAVPTQLQERWFDLHNRLMSAV